MPENEDPASGTSSVPSAARSAKGRNSNNNPTGRNQYKNCRINDKKRLSELLLSEHNITMIDSTVARRRRELGLRASHLTTKEISDTFKRQLVLDQMAKDPAGKLGPRTVKLGIFQDCGIALTRDWIANQMRLLAPEAYASRGPAHNKGRVHPSDQSPSPGIVQVQAPLSPAANTLPYGAESALAASDTQTHPGPPAPSPVSPTSAPDWSVGCISLASMDVELGSDMTTDRRHARPPNNGRPNHTIDHRHPHSRPHPYAHPPRTGLSELADLASHNNPLTALPGNQAISAAFDVLECAMPTLTALGDSLTGVKPGNSREVEIAAKFRKQLAVLDGQLARMATGGASSQF